MNADTSREKASEGNGSPWAFHLETGSLLVLGAQGSVSVSIAWADTPSQGKDEGQVGGGSGYHVPPLEGKGLPAHIGATVHFSMQHVVGCEVINEGAV